MFAMGILLLSVSKQHDQKKRFLWGLSCSYLMALEKHWAQAVMCDWVIHPDLPELPALQTWPGF